MDREKLQKIKDWLTFILLVVILCVFAYGFVQYGGLPIGETPVWLLWLMVLFVVWGIKRSRR